MAWSGGGVVSRVEVSTDGGENWMDADFRGTPQRMAHTAFSFNWTWDGSEAMLMSRCTDELGQVQPTRAQRKGGLDNSIQPWRVQSNGSVTNGLA